MSMQFTGQICQKLRVVDDLKFDIILQENNGSRQKSVKTKMYNICRLTSLPEIKVPNDRQNEYLSLSYLV